MQNCRSGIFFLSLLHHANYKQSSFFNPFLSELLKTARPWEAAVLCTKRHTVPPRCEAMASPGQGQGPDPAQRTTASPTPAPQSHPNKPKPHTHKQTNPSPTHTQNKPTQAPHTQTNKPKPHTQTNTTPCRVLYLQKKHFSAQTRYSHGVCCSQDTSRRRHTPLKSTTGTCCSASRHGHRSKAGADNAPHSALQPTPPKRSEPRGQPHLPMHLK